MTIKDLAVIAFVPEGAAVVGTGLGGSLTVFYPIAVVVPAHGGAVLQTGEGAFTELPTSTNPIAAKDASALIIMELFAVEVGDVWMISIIANVVLQPLLWPALPVAVLDLIQRTAISFVPVELFATEIEDIRMLIPVIVVAGTVSEETFESTVLIAVPDLAFGAAVAFVPVELLATEFLVAPPIIQVVRIGTVAVAVLDLVRRALGRNSGLVLDLVVDVAAGHIGLVHGACCGPLATLFLPLGGSRGVIPLRASNEATPTQHQNQH